MSQTIFDGRQIRTTDETETMVIGLGYPTIADQNSQKRKKRTIESNKTVLMQFSPLVLRQLLRSVAVRAIIPPKLPPSFELQSLFARYTRCAAAQSFFSAECVFLNFVFNSEIQNLKQNFASRCAGVAGRSASLCLLQLFLFASAHRSHPQRNTKNTNFRIFVEGGEKQS